MIDLYSDTVTQPTPGMRQAMAQAAVGDEQRGEDPTTNALQTQVAALLGKEVHSYIEPESLRQALPIQNGGTSARNIAEVCRACFDSSPVEIERIRARVEPGVVQPPPGGDLHLMPQWGERHLLYSLAQGIHHAVRPTVMDRMPPRPVNPVD